MRNEKFARFAWVTLAYTVAVVLWGAIVRATGSGAGCGESWPLCNGQLVFGTPSLAKAIEFTHRFSTGIDGALVLAMVLWARRAFPKGHPARWGAALTVPFLIIEALIGAALVKFGLVVNDPSPARAVMLSLHQANTLALVGSIALTAWWGAGNKRVSWDGRAWTSLAGLIALAITGTLSALADTLYPSALAGGRPWPRIGAAAPTGWSICARLHPFLALAVGLWIVYYASSRMREARRGALAVMALVAAQIAAGVLNLALLTPLSTQVIHLLLADALWIAVIVLCEIPV